MTCDVLVISSLSDPGTKAVLSCIYALGGTAYTVHCEEAVLDRYWTVEIDRRSGLTLRLSDTSGGKLEREPRSVWMRRWGYPVYPAAFDRYSIAFSFNEISAVISALPGILRNSFWINNPVRERAACSKVLQLDTASRCGLRIPRTVVTNDASVVRRFGSAEANIVFKPVSGNQTPYRTFGPVTANELKNRHPEATFDLGEPPAAGQIFTQDLTKERIEELNDLMWSPVMFQEKIAKRSDVRVTVVGERMFACRIFSQEKGSTSTDFRVMNITGMLRHEPFRLPSAIEAMISALMRELGLVFGCIDLVETPDGEWVFLEVNPSGQWFWIEQLTGEKISQALAELLLDGHRSPSGRAPGVADRCQP